MKYSKLVEIVTNSAEELKVSNAYNGGWGDGGCSFLLNKLKDFKEKLIYKYDLRPSEYHKLNDVEVGEPVEFEKIINEYKIKLAKNIKL